MFEGYDKYAQNRINPGVFKHNDEYDRDYFEDYKDDAIILDEHELVESMFSYLGKRYKPYFTYPGLFNSRIIYQPHVLTDMETVLMS